MLDWFVNQQPVVQAAILTGTAALISAFVVSLSAFLTAWVKGSADIRVARQNDRRNFRRKTLETYLSFVDKRAASYLTIARLLFAVCKDKKDVTLLDPELKDIETSIGYLTPFASLALMTKYWRLRLSSQKFLDRDEIARAAIIKFRAQYRPLSEPPDPESLARFEALKDLLGDIAEVAGASVAVYRAGESYIYGETVMQRAESMVRAPWYWLRRKIDDRARKRELKPWLEKRKEQKMKNH